MIISNNFTACPLDCYDACSIEYKDGKLLGDAKGYTKGFLCPHINNYNRFETISKPRYNGCEISMNEAMLTLVAILKKNKKESVLHYRGNGNFALMQEVSDYFFASFGAVLTDGSLCDGAGRAGIEDGRGSNKNMPISEIEKSEVVIVWGRNLSVTSPHIYSIVKNKILIVIDPIRTQVADEAELFLQIKPHGDLYLALLLSRFLYIQDEFDEKYLKQYASQYEELYDLSQTIRIKATLDLIGVGLGDIGKIIDMLRDKKVSILCGVGLQKYSDGADVLRAIDAFGVMLGLFSKEGSGIAYLGNSRENIISPFKIKSKKVSKVNTEFSNYKTVFIQGANPLSQMPNTSRVKKSIKGVENIIYFGLYENDTSNISNLVIPAKNFLSKNDVRLSYSQNNMLIMNKQIESNIGISEYELSTFLCKEFSINIKSESFYIDSFLKFTRKSENGFLSVKNINTLPYINGFDTDNKEFLFLEEYDTDFDMQDHRGNENLFLITPKSKKSLNSQFNCRSSVYVNSQLRFSDGDKILVSSVDGEFKASIKNDNSVRSDCILIYSGTPGVNNLTSSKHSLDGESAIYQENRVSIKLIG